MFKVGDKVKARTNVPYRITRNGWEGVVVSPKSLDWGDDMRVRGENGIEFSVASKYFDLVSSKGKRGRPSTKPKPVKFLLKYDLDEDPIEEFSTMDEVKERIDYLVKNERSLKRDSMVVYEIKKRWTASVSTKIKLSK